MIYRLRMLVVGACLLYLLLVAAGFAGVPQ